MLQRLTLLVSAWLVICLLRLLLKQSLALRLFVTQIALVILFVVFTYMAQQFFVQKLLFLPFTVLTRPFWEGCFGGPLFLLEI
ncbi:MAG: hypothetical protein CMF74_07455 [Maricaulis sp.]|nr:hypothetical protein [Maricaulis sp.]